MHIFFFQVSHAIEETVAMAAANTENTLDKIMHLGSILKYFPPEMSSLTPRKIAFKRTLLRLMDLAKDSLV